MQDSGCRMQDHPSSPQACPERTEEHSAGESRMDSSIRPSASLGMTPFSPCRLFNPTEVSRLVIPTEGRSDFSSCHPDRESRATFQAVIPTERAERTFQAVIPTERAERSSGGIYGVAAGKARNFRRQRCVMTASEPKEAPEQANEPQRHRGIFKETPCAPLRLRVSAFIFLSDQVSPQATEVPAGRSYLC
jgi:hypothetical protein